MEYQARQYIEATYPSYSFDEIDAYGVVQVGKITSSSIQDDTDLYLLLDHFIKLVTAAPAY